MIGCLRTRVRKQPIIALYFESETVLQFYNLEAWFCDIVICVLSNFEIVSLRKLSLFSWYNASVFVFSSSAVVKSMVCDCGISWPY